MKDRRTASVPACFTARNGHLLIRVDKRLFVYICYILSKRCSIYVKSGSCCPRPCHLHAAAKSPRSCLPARVWLSNRFWNLTAVPLFFTPFLYVLHKDVSFELPVHIQSDPMICSSKQNYRSYMLRHFDVSAKPESAPTVVALSVKHAWWWKLSESIEAENIKCLVDRNNIEAKQVLQEFSRIEF